MRGATPVLLGLALLLAAAGAAAWVLPPPTPRIVVPPVSLPGPEPPPDPSQQAAAILSFEEIVQGNVFAEDRRPPRRRYVPPHLAERARAPITRAAPTLRLYGIAAGERGAVALIDADPAVPGAEIYRQGDRVAAYRLEAIADSFVVLTGPGGQRVVRLETIARRAP